MAIPIIPIALIAGVVMFAGASSSKKKRRSTIPKQGTVALPTGGEASYYQGSAPTPTSEPVPGFPCPTPEGSFGAYDNQGQCLVFWTQDSTDSLREVLHEMWDDEGQPMDVCEPDTYWPHKDEWEVNQARVEFFRRALSVVYGVPETSWPTDAAALEDPDVPYWVKMTWLIGNSIALEELCGFVQVT